MLSRQPNSWIVINLPRDALQDMQQYGTIWHLPINEKVLIWVFRNLQWQMEQHFPEFPEKRTTLWGTGIPKFSGMSLGIIVSFDFPPRIYEIFSWMVHLFLRFSRNFQGNFCAILLLFQNFRKNLVERKAPSVIAMSSWGFLGLNHTWIKFV